MPIELLTRRLRAIARGNASAKAPALVLSDLFDIARRGAPPGSGRSSPDAPPHSHHVTGGSHRIRVPTPADASDYLLVLRVQPGAPRCWLTVGVNGVDRRSLFVHMRAVVCCHLTWASIAGAPDLEVTFDTKGSDAADDGGRFSVLDVSLVKFAPPSAALRPSTDVAPDQTLPALGVPASDADLLGHFVSFGDNCEFGLFQRRHGVDGISFLRLAAVPIDGLTLALEERFEACYDPAELYFEILQYPGGRREYILKHQRYKIFWHTLVEEAEVAPAKMLVREYQKLCMLLRMLVEILSAGDRIIVYKCNVALDVKAYERLARLLAPYGRNGLLVVAPAPRKSDVGKVVVTDSGLMLGYIDKFLPDDAVNLRASNVWMTLCRNAFECWRARQASRSQEMTSNATVDPT